MIKRQTEHPMYMDLFRMLIFRRMVISNLSIVQEIPYFMVLLYLHYFSSSNSLVLLEQNSGE